MGIQCHFLPRKHKSEVQYTGHTLLAFDHERSFAIHEYLFTRYRYARCPDFLCRN
jgi:hypothetical protein